MSLSCCEYLSQELGLVAFPDSAAYNATELSYWSTQEAKVAPSCVVTPESSSDVSDFVAIVTQITNCSFAIKGQGHSPAAGTANIQDGVTLDLTSLNTTTISNDHTVASVGTGSAWVDVYRTLQPYNKTVAGGRNGAVGVVGLTLSGGISYYSPQVGFTSDTVVNYEIVLASSEIVNANATTNSDLFYALQGGGNNFGIVTRFDFATVDTVDLAEGHLTNPTNHTEDVLRAFANIVASSNYDVHASIVTSLIFNSTSKAWAVASVPQYTLPNPSPAIYNELFSIPNITAATSFSIENISTLSAEPPYPQIYELFFTATYAASSGDAVTELLINIYNSLNTTLTANSPPGITWALNLEPLPVAFTSHTKHNLFNLNQTENAFLYLLSVSWTNDTVSTAAYSLAQTVLQDMDNLARAQGMFRNFRYANYADPSQDVLGSYGEASVEFLKNVSAKYDPTGVFQYQVPGGFKISNAGFSYLDS